MRRSSHHRRHTDVRRLAEILACEILTAIDSICQVIPIVHRRNEVWVAFGSCALKIIYRSLHCVRGWRIFYHSVGAYHFVIHHIIALSSRRNRSAPSTIVQRIIHNTGSCCTGVDKLMFLAVVDDSCLGRWRRSHCCRVGCIDLSQHRITFRDRIVMVGIAYCLVINGIFTDSSSGRYAGTPRTVIQRIVHSAALHRTGIHQGLSRTIVHHEAVRRRNTHRGSLRYNFKSTPRGCGCVHTFFPFGHV